MENKKRCLWLANHPILRTFAKSLLSDLAIEMYSPRQITYCEDEIKDSIAFETISTLSLSKNEMKTLAALSNISDTNMLDMENVNQYFDIAVLEFRPSILAQFVKKFEGIIILYAPGLENGATYTDILIKKYGRGFLDDIENLGKRFVFGVGLENIVEHECRILKNRASYLPVAVEAENIAWNCEKKKILFSCPNINVYPSRKKLYNNFKEIFQNYEYCIEGMQLVLVKDSKVLEDIPENQCKDMVRTATVMVSLTQEKYCIDYAPLEAAKSGIPLIYLEGSFLDTLTKVQNSGKCKDIHEVKRKIDRVLNGDVNYIEKLKASQRGVAEKFEYTCCFNNWKKLLDEKFALMNENSFRHKKEKPEKKIGFLLNDVISETSIQLIKKIIDVEAIEGHAIIGYLKNSMIERNEIYTLTEMGAQMREFEWQKISKEDIASINRIEGYDCKVDKKCYCIANDGINYFEDCEYLILLSNDIPGQFFSNKAYSVVLAGYKQRYMEKNEKKDMDFFNLIRNATHIYVTSKSALIDCVQYCGVSQNKVVVLNI